ncbi:MAG TPA: SLBB domain-containing protein [Rhizomicrobium sp.]|jgi:protein involved in polysaccharide export with SLBB domain|nr:SLBB domain-containing protein [Rhizomicrobium sp.]
MSLKKVCAGAIRAAVIGLALAAIGSFGAEGQTIPSGTDIQGILNAISGQPSATSTSPAQQVPSSTAAPTQTTLQPATPPAPSAASQAPSHLEQLFSQRAGRQLTQYGYATFGVGSSVPVTQVGALQDSYILGVNDQLNVILRGHQNIAYTATIDREGRIILPDLPPIVAAGRTLGDVRAEIERREARSQIGAQAFVSVGTVRQVSVLVTGEVAAPGVRTLTGLNTPVDAILLSGGIKKTGSLRNVILERGHRRIRLDLYSLVGRGSFAAAGGLTEGDRIIVPPIGQTVAVAGLVKNQGIFELSPGASAITEQSLTALAGGTELAGAKRLTKLELLPDGRTLLVAVAKNGTIKSGEVLFVDFERSASNGVVTLSGEVSVPGTRALGATPTMSRLIRDTDDLTPQSYTLYGVVIRREPKSNFQTIIPFSIENTFEKKEDLKLADNDTVYVFNQSEIATLAAAASAALGTTASASQNPLAPKSSSTSSSNSGVTSSSQSSGTPSTQAGQASTASTSGNAASSSQQASSGMAPAALAALAQNAPSAAAAAALQAGNAPPQPTTTPSAALPSTGAAVVGLGQAQATEGATGGAAATVATNKGAATQVSLDQISSNLGVPTVELVNSARDYLVTINGEVRNPGPYLAVGDSSLGALVAAAGGVQREADLSSVEITSTIIDTNNGTSRTVRNSLRVTPQDFASVSLKPFDSVRLRPVFSDRNGETITILGQVRYPGTFDVTRGERLSSVLARAGGLTDEAYPFGTVFTRQSAAIQEADGNQRTARLLEDNIATVATQPATIVNPAGLSYVEQIAQELRTMPALGRISVTADPVILATKPELDVLLESGDTIYVPKRPATVTVTGAVLSDGAFAYRPGLSVRDYIKLAGGENSSADDDLVFVVLPDGTSRPEGDSWFNFGGGHEIPPGSMVVVPRDPQPFNWTVFAINATDILSKMATTAAALTVIGANRGN